MNSENDAPWSVHVYNKEFLQRPEKLEYHRRRTGLWLVDKQYFLFAFGNWAFSTAIGLQMVGGSIYSHRRKADESIFGGIVLDYKVVTDPFVKRTERIEFIVQARSWGRGADWRGRNFSRDWTGFPIQDPEELVGRQKRTKTNVDRDIPTLSLDDYASLRQRGVFTF